MTLPGDVRSAVEASLEERLGRPVRITGSRPVGGGCISPTARLETDGGDRFFLKRGDADLPDELLAAEARGVEALAATDVVRVPAVLGVGAPSGSAWLLLEWLEPGSGSAESWERLGRDLAALHRARARRFGADASNYIGPLPQDNTPTENWPEFWRDRRLEPQLRRAEASGLLGAEDRDRFHQLYDRLPELLAPAAEEGPSLLHGDLWSGNVHMMNDGTPAIIDPSVYHGHREVDLAMAELFGGFGGGFRSAYEEAWPLAPGYAPVRRAIYQLYYLLVHVNLFGAGYIGRTRQALSAAGV